MNSEVAELKGRMVEEMKELRETIIQMNSAGIKGEVILKYLKRGIGSLGIEMKLPSGPFLANNDNLARMTRRGNWNSDYRLEPPDVPEPQSLRRAKHPRFSYNSGNNSVHSGGKGMTRKNRRKL